MLSKIFQIAILVFWAGMTTQLWRYLYHNNTRDAFHEVPAKSVMELFLKQEDSTVPLLMYQHGKKLGSVSVSIRELRPRVHSLTLMGRVDEDPNKITSKVKYSWNGTLILENTEILKSMRLLIRLAQQGIETDINSMEGSNELNYEIRHSGIVLFSSKKTPVNQLITSAFGGGDVTQMMAAGVMSSLGIKLPDGKAPPAAPSTAIKARSSAMYIGGQNREIYTLTFEPITGQILEMIFNRAGELMLVKAPSQIELRSPVWFPEI